MPTTPDRPDGRPAGSEDPFADALSLAARETVPVDVGAPTSDRSRRAGEGGSDRTTVPLDSGARDAGGRGSGDRDRNVGSRDSGGRDARKRDSGAGDHEGEDVGARPTVKVDSGAHPTVTIDEAALGRRETVRLPGRRTGGGRGRAPLVVAAGFATVWAALLSYVPVTAVIGLARTLEGAGGLGGATHAGLAGWLLGHGVPINTSIGPLALAPLLLTLLVTWRLSRAGVHVTRAIGARHSGSPGAALRVAGTIGVAYAILGWLAALAVDGRGTDVSPARAAVNFLVLGLLGSLIGSLRSTDGLVVLARRMPAALRHGLRAGAVAALLIVAMGGVFAGLSVAVGGGQAADMIAAYHTGVAGQAGITLISLAYGANATVWAAAYLLGPGFLLGTASVIRLTEVTVGPLPTLPLLAGLPNGPMGATGALLLAVPVLTGMAAGWLLTRRLSHGRGHGAPNRPVQGGHVTPQHSAQPAWSLVVGAALIAGPVAGLVLGGLAWVSGGALGDGRMSEIGPVPWQVALVATAVVSVSATIGAATARAFRAGPAR